jgi:M6 family metalloprotease-like protein
VTLRLLRLLPLALGFGWAGLALGAPPAPGKRGRTVPPAHALSRANVARAYAKLQALHSNPARKALAGTDSVRLVALRVEFPDLRMGESPPADELHDRFYFETHFANVVEYYRSASAGRLALRVDVADSVALAARPQADYGDVAVYDSSMVELTAEAVAAFDPRVDFSAYDGVILLHAGPGQESDIAGNSPTQIWSGYLDQPTFAEQLSTPDSTVHGLPTADGTLVSDVVILPEWEVQDLVPPDSTRLGSLGVSVFEIGQKLGMIPLYDPDPAPIPDSQGVGNFCVMSYGLWVGNGFIPVLPCAFNRALMGWVDPWNAAAEGERVLRDYERGPPDSVVVRVPISEREYFLVSYILEDPDGPLVLPCRGTTQAAREWRFDDKNQNCRFDYIDTNGDGVLSAGDAIDGYVGSEWDFFMTDLLEENTAGNGYGLLVLHVDEEVLHEAAGAAEGSVQSDPRRKAVDVEEADTIEDLDRFPDNVRSYGSAGDYFVRGRVFGPQTIPNTRSTNGAPTGISIELIALPDSTANPAGAGVPGARARLSVRRNVATGSAPRASARREVAGRWATDLVALALEDGRRALVVPGDSGAVYLLDPHLDEAPVSDGDSTTLQPWVVVPPELRGVWAGAPAVGDLDGDGVSEVALTASVDSLGTTITRLFVWRRDGSAFPGGAGGGPYLASIAGRAQPPLLFDVDGTPGEEIFIAADDSTGIHFSVQLLELIICPTNGKRVAETGPAPVPGWHLAGGPVGVRLPEASGIAWIQVDSLAGRAELGYWPVACGIVTYPSPVAIPGVPAGSYRMVAGDLDGDGTETIVFADGSGAVYAAGPGQGAGIALRRIAALGEAVQSPLALADLDGNGTLEIVLATTNAMHVLNFSGAEMQGWPYPFRLEPQLEAEPEPGRGMGSPLVADLNGDGSAEVMAHLYGGALLVWSGSGQRLLELEAALPATGVASPLLADLDGDGQAEQGAVARFDRVLGFDAFSQTLRTAPVTEFAVWKWPSLGVVRWSELGGDGRHAFRAERAGPVVSSPNDSSLPSFVVAPNPASRLLTARVELAAAARVRCSLYNLEGETVREESRDGRSGEVVEFVLDVSHFASGTYLARMELSTGGQRVRPVVIRR